MSGLKKRSYENNRHLIEKLLGLDTGISVAELCAQLGCDSIQNTAQKLYDKYKQTDSMNRKDFTHPQYVTMAVYTVCRLQGVKVRKSKLVEVSRLKPSQWVQLENEFNEFATSSGIGLKNNLNAARIVDNIDKSDISCKYDLIVYGEHYTPSG